VRSWQDGGCGQVYYERNVSPPGLADWRNDYRVPDLVLVRPQHYARDLDTHFSGGPTVAVEIHTPGDEAYDKLPFLLRGRRRGSVDHPPRHQSPGAVPARRAGVPARRAGRRGLARECGDRHAMRSAPNARLSLRLGSDPASEAVVPSLRR
jgi:hypothetical protein